MEHTGKTLLDYFKVIKRSSHNDDIQYSPGVNQLKSTSSNETKRSANYFDGCITIDDDDMKVTAEDDDIQEIERKR